jgi:hypothetical protein
MFIFHFIPFLSKEILTEITPRSMGPSLKYFKPIFRREYA